MIRKIEMIKIIDLIKHDIKSYYIDETETLETIKMVKNSYNYIIDPHTAVAFASSVAELLTIRTLGGVVYSLPPRVAAIS